MPYQASFEPCPPEAVPALVRAVVRDSLEHVLPDECTQAPTTGPFCAKHHLDDSIRVSAAPFSVLASSHTGPKAVPLQVYEALSLIGAAVGFLLIAWFPLWARRMASTSMTGGGGFLLATATSCFLAALLLWMCDWGARFVALLQRQPWAVSALGSFSVNTSRPIVKTSAVLKLDDSCEHSAAPGASAGVAESPSCKEALSVECGEHSLGTFVPVAGRTRPDMGALLRRTPPEARVAVGGPPAMLATVAKELSKAGRAPFVCLTHSM